MTPSATGFYVTLNIGQAGIAAPAFVADYFFKSNGRTQRERALHLLEPLVAGSVALAGGLIGPVESGALRMATPSTHFPPRFDAETLAALPDRIVLSFHGDDRETLEIARRSAPMLQFFESLGSDLAFDAVDHWCPGGPPNHQFGDRGKSGRLIGSQRLAEQGLSGAGVDVVVVDRGLDACALGESFGGGWSYCPGGLPPCLDPGSLVQVPGVTDNGHGMMTARNVLAVAPGARLHDLPLLPARINDLPRFLSEAQAAFERVLADIRLSRQNNPKRSWILVNAWAVFDPSQESPAGDYSGNPDHPFNRVIADLDREGVDLVFAVGNCGQFGADRRCGRRAIGSGRSIHGANAHPGVLSVGAVRSDGLWIGSSSQGPGPQGLSREKPDLAAPSLFSETHDRQTRNGGSSAACAIAAGAIAALRERWPSDGLSPADLRSALRKTARRTGPAAWDGRIGWGVLGVDRALEFLAEDGSSGSRPQA